ncbi:hypothetical protein OROHE_004698 [Orobanche hederae]
MNLDEEDLPDANDDLNDSSDGLDGSDPGGLGRNEDLCRNPKAIM